MTGYTAACLEAESDEHSAHILPCVQTRTKAMKWHCSQFRWIFPSQLIYSRQAQRLVSYLVLNCVNLTVDINHHAQEWPPQREVMRNIPHSLQRSKERTAIVCSQVSDIWVKFQVYIIKKHYIYYLHEENVQGQQSAKSDNVRREVMGYLRQLPKDW